MKILTISNYYPSHPGGIEFVALNLVKHWRAHHQVRWMACDVKKYPHLSETDDIPLRAINFAEERLGFPYPIPIGKWLFQVIEQVKWCDVLHMHDSLYLANIVAFLISRWYRKPLLVTQHVGLVPYKEKWKMGLQWFAYQTIGRFILERADEIIFINGQVKEWFETRMNIHRTSLIQNGVDNQIFYPASANEKKETRMKLRWSEDDIVLLFIGRFTQKKGIHLIREIAVNRREYHWIIIGRGDVDILQWNLPNLKVFSPQPQAGLREFYIASDLLVLPSTGEGFPLAVQEALSCGLPAAVSEEVAASMPDAPLLRLKTLSLPQILGTLDEILKEPDHRARLQVKSKEFAKQWDWAITARKYEELIVRAMARYSN
jgi:glycosyltransferase involved in cell wall biosynthesis